jgi:uncharacterized protein YraI
MKLKYFFTQLIKDLSASRAVVLMIATTWFVISLLVIGGLLFYTLEQSGQALEPTPGQPQPVILIEPTRGAMGTQITVRGQGWSPNATILIYVVTLGQTDLPAFNIAGTVTDANGQFVTTFAFPTEPRWEAQTEAIIVAWSPDTNTTIPASFSLVTPEGEASATPILPTLVATPSPTPTLETATLTPTLTPILTATPTPPPAQAHLTVTAGALNVRSGPGTHYGVIGLLENGQTAEITGRSPDSQWWQISFPGVTDGHGWVAARYVEAAFTADVPVVQPPVYVAAVTPTPIPVPTATPLPPAARCCGATTLR